MRFSKLGAVAALGVVSQAFLLPPTITPADNEIVKTLPFEDAVAIDGRVVFIVCPGCPVSITNLFGQTKSAASRVDSKFPFNFSISHGDADQLLLNGHQLYPIDPTSEDFLGALTADQLVKTSAGTWNYAATPKLSYALAIRHPVTSSNNEQLDLVVLNLEILDIGGGPVHGFPAFEIKLLETQSGKLMIGDVEITHAQSPSTEPTDKGQECATTICKWGAIIADKMSKLKGCGGKRPQHGSVKPMHHGHARPTHGAHRGHRHHHRHGGFARFLRSAIFHVFIPILIGVVVGITASLVGMIVGHIAIFIWRILFRRGQRAEYHRVQQEEGVAKDDDDESKGFLEHDSPPPVYEDSPAYEETVVVEKA